jgi:hypothetical protein
LGAGTNTHSFYWDRKEPENRPVQAPLIAVCLFPEKAVGHGPPKISHSFFFSANSATSHRPEVQPIARREMADDVAQNPQSEQKTETVEDIPLATEEEPSQSPAVPDLKREESWLEWAQKKQKEIGTPNDWLENNETLRNYHAAASGFFKGVGQWGDQKAHEYFPTLMGDAPAPESSSTTSSGTPKTEKRGSGILSWIMGSSAPSPAADAPKLDETSTQTTNETSLKASSQQSSEQ